MVKNLVLGAVFAYSTASLADICVNTSWCVELSDHKLIDKSATRPTQLKDESPYPLYRHCGYQSKGLILSAFGKTAVNQSSSMFYRIAMMYRELDYSMFSAGKADCAQGVKTNVKDNWFGRIEANHFFANKGEAISAAKLSIGYKF